LHRPLFVPGDDSIFSGCPNDDRSFHEVKTDVLVDIDLENAVLAELSESAVGHADQGRRACKSSNRVFSKKSFIGKGL
jgi:hypothetical protein